MVRLLISDRQWKRIKPLLPGKAGDPGRTAKDNRLAVEAILWIARTSAPWRDLPGRFGRWTTAYQRFNRWVKSGVLEKVFHALNKALDCWQPAKMGHLGTREIRGLIEV